jgi:riboflavin synthase
MFTGLVQTTGTWRRLEGADGGRARLWVRAELPGGAPETGESIAVNGVCLTLTEARGGELAFDVLEETLARTAFREKRAGATVNIERALRAGDALGGHFVTGHVDATGTLVSANTEPSGDRVARVKTTEQRLFAWMLPKGSVALDGISLTLVDIAPEKDEFTVHVIPHTWAHTALSTLRPGDALNIECDLLAKAVRRAAETPADSSTAAGSVTWERLRQAGFC